MHTIFEESSKDLEWKNIINVTSLLLNLYVFIWRRLPVVLLVLLKLAKLLFCL